MNAQIVSAQPDWIPNAVIYFNPRDYPGMYVVRVWMINRETGSFHPAVWPSCVGPSLDEARATVLREWPNLVRLDRHPTDEPAIVETWV